MDVYNWGFLKQRCIRCGEEWWDTHTCSTDIKTKNMNKEVLNPLVSLKEILEYIKQNLERIEELENLLKRIRQWDHLDLAGDGSFWKKEIDTVLNGNKKT